MNCVNIRMYGTTIKKKLFCVTASDNQKETHLSSKVTFTSD